jgi:uncharacterized integral membrane protein
VDLDPRNAQPRADLKPDARVLSGAHRCVDGLALGLTRPRATGLAVAAIAGLLLVFVILAFALITGSTVTLLPGWRWLIPGLFAQAGVAVEILFRGHHLGPRGVASRHSGSGQDRRRFERRGFVVPLVWMTAAALLPLLVMFVPRPLLTDVSIAGQRAEASRGKS